MVKEILILSIILCSSGVLAQTEVKKSKIKFIDGSEFHVIIKENLPGQHVKMILSDNEEVTIQYANILSIKHKDFSYYSKYVRSKGFYVEGSSTILFGKASELDGSRLGVALGVSANYQLNSYLSVGVGAEPTAILITNESILIPFFAHFRYNILERKVAPVFSIDTGWSFVSKKAQEGNSINYEGGLYVRPTIGLQMGKFTLNLGYQLQKITTITDQTIGWWRTPTSVVEERLMKNITFGGSYQF
jgi:hypothetical protein